MGQRDRKRVSEHGVSFKKALKAGVKIVFGTDMGGIPWTEPIAQEFPRMAEFGMSPMDIIKSATSRAADMLDMTGQIGVVAPGAYADVIAVNGDPLRDIKVLGDVTLRDERRRSVQERSQVRACLARSAANRQILRGLKAGSDDACLRHGRGKEEIPTNLLDTGCARGIMRKSPWPLEAQSGP